MKRSLIAILWICVLIVPNLVYSEEKPKTVRVNRQSRTAGTEWISFGPGVISVVRSAELFRVRMTKEEMKIETYVVEGEKNLEKLKKWLAANVTPILKTRPLNEGIYASRPRLSLVLYGDEKRDQDKYLMSVPLSVVYEEFDDKLFESLLLEWGAKQIE